jgi:hypothetical protein
MTYSNAPCATLDELSPSDPQATSIVVGMRRARHDVFANATGNRYIVLCYLQWQVIECMMISAGSKLRQGLVSAVERLQADDWKPEGAPDYGFVFLSRGGERRLLALGERDP